jgi:hypothetical protein
MNVLPLISKSLNHNDSKDLKTAGLLAISQIASRRTLSSEYLAAFIR